MKYAARLNSFTARADLFWNGRAGKPTTIDLIGRASQVRGLTAIDLNYPDHFANTDPAEIFAVAADQGLEVNGLAMRYYSEPEFKLGAFTHSDARVRRAAIDLTKRAIDLLAQTGGDLLTIWLGQDGWDYPFQVDFAAVWELEMAALRELADYNSLVKISIEYKPNDPRSHNLLADVGTTLLAIKEIDRSNLGVTLDFAHVLYAGESPAFAAALIQRLSQLLGLHLNDGYGRRDDGLMAGSVNLMQTLELLFQLRRQSYSGPIYFDTFPDLTGLDPVRECANNVAMVDALWQTAGRLLDQPDLHAAIQQQDAVASQDSLRRIIFGG